MLGFYYPLLLLSVLFIPVNNDTKYDILLNLIRAETIHFAVFLHSCVLAWVFTYVCGLTLFSRHKEIRFLLPVLPFIHVRINFSKYYA